MLPLFIVLFIIVIAGYFIFKKKPEKPLIIDEKTEKTYASLLAKNVEFYEKLTAEAQPVFLQKVERFINDVNIEGVGVTVTDLDKVLVASSAIIPIWGFDEWKYLNIGSVVLYPDTFNHEYKFAGGERNILGMVGDGAMNRQMILSKQALHEGFKRSGKSNTGIHEFVHLLDKSDGSTDGVPENLMKHSYTIPWLKAMHTEINEIKKGKSDIDPYAATNDAEFLAVASEYFFEKPTEFKAVHPELYDLLSIAFNQNLVEENSN